MTTTIVTWAAHAATLPEGLAPEAVELIRRATASTRHRARVEMAKAALAALAETHGAFMGDDGDRAVAVAALAAIASNGIGGPLNAGGRGCATTRFPGLDQLGSGRRQAGDGSAWDAAITAAAAHGGVSGLTIEPSTHGPSVIEAAGRQHAGGARWTGAPALCGLPPEWLAATARRAVLVLSGAWAPGSNDPAAPLAEAIDRARCDDHGAPDAGRTATMLVAWGKVLAHATLLLSKQDTDEAPGDEAALCEDADGVYGVRACAVDEDGEPVPS